MRDDPNWIDVTVLMKAGNAGIGPFVAQLSADPARSGKIGEYVPRLSTLLGTNFMSMKLQALTKRSISLLTFSTR
jgi:hypothetical protein